VGAGAVVNVAMQASDILVPRLVRTPAWTVYVPGVVTVSLIGVSQAVAVNGGTIYNLSAAIFNNVIIAINTYIGAR
jgi:hypothetical protein